MNKFADIFVKFIGTGIIVLISWSAWGQAGSTKVSVKVVAFYQGRDSKGAIEGKNEYRWNFWYNGASSPICLEKKAKDPGWWKTPILPIASGVTHNRVPGYDEENPPLYITMESWEEDNDDDCTYDSENDDIHYGPGDITYNLYKAQPPGQLSEDSDKRESFTYDLNNKITYEFFYTPPTPEAPLISGGSSVVCVTDAVTLSTNTFVYSAFLDQVLLEWEYWIEGDMTASQEPNPDHCAELCLGTDLPCCWEPPYITTYDKNWRTLSPTVASISNGDHQFHLNELDGLTSLSERTRVYFRVRSLSNDTYGEYSEESSLEVDPPGPEFSVTAIQASCLAAPTGKARLTVHSNGTGEYRYLITKEGESTGMTGRFRAASDTIHSLEPGEYTVTLSNYRGGSAHLSKCDFTQPVVIDAISPIRWNNTNTQVINPSCFGGSGTVEVEVEGGSENEEVTFSIDGDYAFSPSEKNARRGSFVGLPAGTFNVTAYDACSHTTLTKTFTVSEPPEIWASVTSTHPTCDSPADGAITVEVSKGSGTYDFELWKGLTKLASVNNNSSSVHTFSRLETGTDYTVRVYDATRRACDPYEKSKIALLFTPLSLTLDSKTDIQCSGDHGDIVLTARGGSGSYTYTISHQTEGYTMSNTTGHFSVDRGGSYKAFVTNNNDCSDRKSITDIVISEPAPLQVTTTRRDIVCPGNYDGKLTAAAAGGVAPYTFQWQERSAEGEVWYNYAGQGAGTAEITNLYDARYRLIVTDQNGCQFTTEEFILNEPEALIIHSAEIRHVSCRGAADGQIRLEVAGEDENYEYQYQIVGEAEYTAFTDHSLFAPGTYRVRAINSNGCIASYPEELTITEPSRTLELTYQVSHFGQYEVSCYGAADGWIEAAAQGGNELGTTNEYQYSLNELPFSSQSRFGNLSAGTYQLQVRDERGCIVTQSITLSSPDKISLSVLDKNYIQCFGDSSGTIILKAEGGSSPYRYRLNSEAWQSSPVFEELPAGSYTFTVADQQGCEELLQVSLETNDQLSITFSKTDVICQGENTGEIRATIHGGQAPYSLNWQGTSSTDQYLGNLPPGKYSLSVTDAEGCQTEGQVLIEEISSVDLRLPDTVNLCANQQVVLDATTPGGQYEWFRNGISFSTQASITVTQPGAYELIAINELGCRESAVTHVSAYDTLFEANFLQTTELAVGDTLTLTEVCYPLPDSVHWSYPQGTTVLTPSAGEPQITFEESGSYQVTMIGYYSVCTDSVTKTVYYFPPQEVGPDSPPALRSPQGIKTLAIYPNPTLGRFSVDVSLYSSTTLSAYLTNAQGEEVARTRQQNNDVYHLNYDISGYASGQYFLRLTTAYDQKIVRILLQ